MPPFTYCTAIMNFRIDLINFVKSFVVDFESLSDSNNFQIQLSISLCNDNKNNTILKISIIYIMEANRLILLFLIKITFFYHFLNLSCNSCFFLFFFRFQCYVITVWSNTIILLFPLYYVLLYLIFPQVTHTIVIVAVRTLICIYFMCVCIVI